LRRCLIAVTAEIAVIGTYVEALSRKQESFVREPAGRVLQERSSKSFASLSRG